MQTEGVNFSILAKFAGVVDLSKIRSNDIYAVLTTYGVEAARRSIVDEINGVFKVQLTWCLLPLHNLLTSVLMHAGVRYRSGLPPLGHHRRLHDFRGRLQAVQQSWHVRIHVAVSEDVLRDHDCLPCRRHHVPASPLTPPCPSITQLVLTVALRSSTNPGEATTIGSTTHRRPWCWAKWWRAARAASSSGSHWR